MRIRAGILVHGGRRWLAAAAGLLVFLVASEALAGGGKPATRLVSVADTRHMAPGLNLWVANLYNTNLWMFSLAVVLIMAAMGGILGFAFDRGMGLLGINLGKLEHRE